jgi:hypothetical protein
MATKDDTNRARSPAPATSRAKVRTHRERLRQQGLRPVQLWVPETRSQAFAAEARRQSLAVSQSRHAQDDQAFVDSIADLGKP